jgi:uncharacterized protein YjbJ (UPF0337 family)
MKQFEGQWEQLKGQVSEKWDKLTNDDVAVIHGKKDQLIGKLRERYGYTQDKAESEFGSFLKSCSVTTKAKSNIQGQA